MTRRSGSWTRELVEMAALFLAVATADLFAGSQAHLSRGTVVLAAIAVVLVSCAVVHHRLRHRAPAPAPAPPAPTAPVAAHDVPDPAPEPAPTAMWRVRATVRDTPGCLANVTARLATHDVNILSVQVHPVAGGVVDEFLVEARLSAGDLAAAVSAGGGRTVTVSAADTHDLVDIPTRILTMVAGEIAEGVDLAQSTRALLGDCAVTWEADGEPIDGPDGTTLRLADPEGGVLTITRRDLEFTPAEYARVRALLDLDDALGRRLRAQRSVLRLACGTELTLRQATAADVPALAAMHDRCGPDSLHLRYLGGSPTRAALTYLVNRRHGRTLVAEHDGGIVAMGNLMLDGADSEVALLVEDSWQRRGIGTLLFRGLLTGGDRPTVAVTAPHNTAMLHLLRRAGAELTRLEPGAAHLTLDRSAPS